MSELALERVWSEPLKDVSLRGATGVSVIIGAESDGAGALVELCAGVRVPRRGRVLLGGESPCASPESRRRIASLLPIEETVRSGDVQRWLAELAALRGFALEAVLEPCRVSAGRALGSLSGAERRELACWVALAEPQPALVALHEPLSACAPEQRERLVQRLGELGRASVVLVTTASVADARRLGGSSYRLDRGVLAPTPKGAWLGGSLSLGAGAHLTVEADAPRRLSSALAQHPDVQELQYDEPAGRVVLRGPDLERLALAVARVAVDAGIQVSSLRPHADELEALRAATTALNDAANDAYRAVHARARGAASATPAPDAGAFAVAHDTPPPTPGDAGPRSP